MFGGFMFLLLPVVGLLFLIHANIGREKKKTPPGPTGLPIIGNLHQLGSLDHRKLSELSNQYGPLMHLQLGSVPAVVISSAEIAKVILKENDVKVSNRPSLTPMRHISFDFSDVALSSDNAKWRELRKIFVAGLLTTKRVDGFRCVREEEVGRMISSLSSLASSSKPINLSKLLFAMIDSTIIRATFGRRSTTPECGIVQKGYDYTLNRHNDLFREAEILLSEFCIADFIPWAGWVDTLTGLRTRLKKTRAHLDARCQEIIEAHANLQTDLLESEEDFVDVLLRLQKEGNTNLTTENIKGIIMNVLIGGTITSYATTEFAMAELIKNPEAMRKAQEEIRDVVGTKGKVEEIDIPQLKYLKLVMKETLRLHPTAPLLLPRETKDAINILNYKIPAKTMVMVNVWAIGRNPDMWQNSHEFIPERFIDSTIDYKGQDLHLIPFGLGRRICPGIAFAMKAVELALANLLYAFDWKGNMGNYETVNMDERSGMVACLKNDLCVTAIKYKY